MQAPIFVPRGPYALPLPSPSFPRIAYVPAVMEPCLNGGCTGVRRRAAPNASNPYGKNDLYCFLQNRMLTAEQMVLHAFPVEQVPGYVAEKHNFPQKQACNYRGMSTFVPNTLKSFCSEKRRFGAMLENGVYSCCGQVHGCVGSYHHSTPYSDYHQLENYVKTTPSAYPRFKCYALDTEMCRTKLGLELTRISVVDEDLNVVYDSYVKPENEILDYNTLFSGITENDLKDVTVTIGEVQSRLLRLFDTETIVIGHALENDFKALKLMHSKVVDTSVLFPHSRGFPYKRSLRSLASQFLNLQIQKGGHNSIEDARVCMKLIYYLYVQ